MKRLALLIAALAVVTLTITGCGHALDCPKGKTLQVVTWIPHVMTINKAIVVTQQPIYGCVSIP